MKLKPTMKKAFLLFILIVNCFLSSAQHSSIVISIKDANEQKFLDKIESKLLKHLNEVQNHKRECDIALFDINPYGWGWQVQKTRSELDVDTAIQVKSKTDKYKLDLLWNDDLDSAFVIGFSREYNWEMFTYTHWSNLTSMGIHCLPIYHIPLKQYSAFLSKDEIKQLYSIIKLEFVDYVNDDTISQRDKEISIRTIAFNKSDSLTQAPWDYWALLMYCAIKNKYKRFPVYRDFYCSTNAEMTKTQADSSLYIFERIMDSVGIMHQIELGTSFSALNIVEKWSFDTNSKIRDEIWQMGYTCLSFSRKIISMGIIKDVPTRYVSTYNPIWFSPNGMDEVFKNKEQLSLYKELINSALYRRLHLTYPRQY